MKQTIRWVAVLIGLVLTVFLMIELTKRSAIEPSTLFDPEPTLGWARGNPDAPLILVEYSDFQCPSCARYHPMLERLIEEFQGQILLNFRYYPLEKHAHAVDAALAAEAAGRQGRFWEMHDLLFETQEQWSEETSEIARTGFIPYAERLDLDVAQFRRDIRSPTVVRRVDECAQSGVRSGVTGTPTFFLNGKQITERFRDYDAFREFILQNLPPSP